MITARKELAWTVVRAFQLSPGIYREIKSAFEQNSVCEMCVPVSAPSERQNCLPVQAGMRIFSLVSKLSVPKSYL
jgi:hypothetical protein